MILILNVVSFEINQNQHMLRHKSILNNGNSMSKDNEIKEWNNRDNIQFYETICIDEFKDLVKRGGFENNQDIQLIMPYLKNVNSIIEIGAGYGRVIGALRNLGFKGSITAIERSLKLSKYIAESYGDDINLINNDIENLEPSYSFDAALFMWCNISEWPKEQQRSRILNISKWLNSGGLLIIESINAEQTPMNSSSYLNQTFVCKNNSGYETYGYIPTENELDNFFSDDQLTLIDKIHYETSTKRRRIIYVLRKN
jgi:hypothetical protein